jgi:hypothetical protein
VTRDERPPSTLGKAVALLLALLPPARMAWIVFTNGENNLSNDYGMRVPLVASMLDGSCSFAKYVREAWVAGSHSLIAVTPIYYLNARFFEWSVWFELGFGLALAAATLALLTAAVPRSARWPLLPLLSLLLFSTSRVTVFTFGEPTLQYGLSQLGVAIGAFALARWPGRPVALALALAFGGILASWSWGGGIMTWPVFAVALLLLRVRSPGAWAIFLSGTVVGVAQYAWLLFFSAPESTAVKMSPRLDFRAILDLLGRPFISGIGDYGPSLASQTFGLVGIAVLAILIFRGRSVPQRAPAFVLIGWSLLVATQIAAFRSEAAPWYVYPMALFWAGLAVLLVLTPVPFRGAGIAVIALLALIVQRTWEDKSFYLLSRSPASAACLREWRTAPPGCSERLFQWKGGAPPAWLGEPLEHHHLSVFGSRRTYLLQGDLAVGRVVIESANLSAFLSRDGVTGADPNDFQRLYLVLAPDASVTWRVDLPPNLKSAQFRTRVRVRDDDGGLARGVSLRAEAGPTIAESRAFVERGGSGPLTLDLREFKGRAVTLRLHAEESPDGRTLILQAPRVMIELTGPTP